MIKVVWVCFAILDCKKQRNKGPEMEKTNENFHVNEQIWKIATYK